MIFLWLGCVSVETDAYEEHRVINEIMCHSAQDWIELYAAEPLDISGWTLVDAMRDGEEPWAFPGGTTVDGFLIVYMDGESGDGLHAPFRLDSNGGDLLLADGDGLVDEGRFPLMLADVSWARVPDGGPYWEQRLAATPGESNGEVR